MSWRNFLREEPFVAEWLSDRPVSTQRQRSAYMQSFCEFTKISPEEFVRLPMKTARNVVWSFVGPISRRYPRKALAMMATYKSFYRYGTGGDVLSFDSRRGGAHYVKYVRNGDQHIPSKREVYRVADCSGSLMGKAIVLVLFQSGMRPNALCSLDYGHVRRQLEEGSVPLRLKVTAQLDSKMMSYELDSYYTWVQGEGMQALKAYVDEEMRKGGWSDGTPLFHSRTGRRYTSLDLHFMLKRWMRKAGLDTRRTSLYCLRKAFFKVLMKTPMDDPNFKEALMGHKLPGSRGNYFDYHDLEKLEREYMKANFGRFTPKSETALLREQLDSYERYGAVLEFLAKPDMLSYLEDLLRSDGLREK